MSCNCNDDNEYIIQLDNVGVDGYSPTINFTNQTNESFTITVNAINGTTTSDAIPTYAYLTNSLNTINNTLSQLDTTYLKVDGSNANDPIVINNISLDKVGQYGLIGTKDIPLTIKGSILTHEVDDTNNATLSVIQQKNNGDITIKSTFGNIDITGNQNYMTGTRYLQVRGGSEILTLRDSDYSYLVTSASDFQFISRNDTVFKYNGNEIATVNQIPTVNNSTITLTQGGVTKGSFTVNSSSDVTIDLDAGGGTTTDAERIVYNGNISGSFELTEYNNLLAAKYSSGYTSLTIPIYRSLVAGNGINIINQETDIADIIYVLSSNIAIDPAIVTTRETQYTPTGQSYTIDTTINEGKVNIKDGSNNDEITIEANKVTFTSGGSSNTLTTSGGDLTYQGNEIIDTNNLSNYLDGELKTINSESLVGTGDIKLLSDNNDTSNMIEAHKAYEADGDLLTDSDGLAFVKKYANSTFDLSKFTVVGSPTITNDGIASGFSTSDYLTIPVTINNETDIVIKGNFTYGTLTGRQWLFICYNSSAANESIQLVPYDNGGLSVRVCIGANTFGSMSWNETEVPRTVGATYNFEIRINGTNASATINGVTKSRNDFYPFTSTTLRIGSGVNNFPFLGSTDLKQFSITVNGVEVFNSITTGIDTIKPDNYTVVGTPTISADGVASGLNSSNYLILPNKTFGNNWELNYEVIWNTATRSNSSNILQIKDGTVTLQILNQASKAITSSIYNMFSSTKYISYITGDEVSQFANGDVIQIKLKVSNNVLYYYVYKNGTLFKSSSIDSITNNIGTTTEFAIGIYSNTTTTMPIDLNAFKIYIDGNLVYQPCLKIPYTLSKTGSKVVDRQYRDRVSDMYEQYGYAPYYTLSDTDFTLPMGEIYGIIGQRTLRDTYRNGIFYYDLYSDRTLEQGGSCTSGTAVTFLKPFIDTNYVLTVQYSTKTTTGFTPSQTGDWIAKGIGEL